MGLMTRTTRGRAASIGISSSAGFRRHQRQEFKDRSAVPTVFLQMQHNATPPDLN
jgi:hypothetical protein